MENVSPTPKTCGFAQTRRWERRWADTMDVYSNDNIATKARGNALSNQLLAALGPESRSRIDPHLEPVTLKLGAVVCEAGGLLKHAYFRKGRCCRC